MPSSPNDRKYSSNHQWIMTEGSPAKMGITAYRASVIGAANAVLLPPVDLTVKPSDNIGKITGALGNHDLLGLVNGSVPDRNDILLDGIPAHPEYVTSDPYGLGPTGGWLVEVKITGTDPRPSMMSAAEYDALYPPPV